MSGAAGAISNEELIQKAVITTDAIASQGKLNPAQSDRFIDFVIQETVLKDNARVIRFRNESLEIDKIGVGKRVTVPVAEAQDPGTRKGINTSKVTLTPREVMTPFEIGDSFKEVNIEGDDVEETVIRLMATQMANDFEGMYTEGDVLGVAATEDDLKDTGNTTQYIKDSLHALFDGWLRIADGGNLVDANGSNIGLGILSQMVRSMPTKFRRNRSTLRWYLASDLWQLYIEKLATRATAMGDAATEGQANTPFGIRAVEVPLFNFLPNVVEHVTLSGTTPVALRYGPVQNEVVTLSTLGQTPTTPFVGGGTDYTLNALTGQINREAAGAIGDGAEVKVTYQANPQILLTHMMNFIVGIGRDIRIEKDRDIFKRVNQYAITSKVSVNFEENTAIVKAYNLGQGV